ncbi:dihydroxyacetone kinase subunit DhaL [Rhizobium sp. GN54]|uniref:dihydroxyacetone kinase subunit DhaL n=1 Tax=Rhizobium sp. GN54 TaxID=2898150 RepID=UPI001E605A3B|nr:dihydroxyacetone kinase subunit DhaL [Rhizobium sp. GN54]MCD2183477.1 dihydroxyacetone kinase subunit L [Rhizobium sp. GN54]
MEAGQSFLPGLIEACSAAIAHNADHLCLLDQEIGDGDHGTNMRRGCEAVFEERHMLAGLPLPQALERIGMTLVMSVGGASGPLYGTLLVELGRGLAGEEPGVQKGFSSALSRAVDAVARRGRSGAGEKTLLDVLYPVQSEVRMQSTLDNIAIEAQAAAERTVAMKAERGRASFLGDRSIGHMDPGACSCALLTGAICRYLGETEGA